MSRLTLLFVLISSAAFGLCPSNVRVEVTDSSLHVELRTDVPGRTTRARLLYGLRPEMGLDSGPKLANHPSATTRVLNVADILPGLDKLYFDPQVSDLQGENWSDYASCQAQICPSASRQAGGYMCEPDGKGALVPYISTPNDSGALSKPEPPRHTRVNPRERPAINGKITKLTDCTSVQQALNDHGAGGTKDPSLNHEIRLPRGVVCRPEQEDSAAGRNLSFYTLPRKAGKGVTLITCDWGPLEGPPPGVQYTTRLRTQHSCGFGLNRRTAGSGSAYDSNGALFTAARCNTPPCTRGWRFEALVIETGDWRKHSARRVAIQSADAATGRLTTAEPIDDIYSANSEMNVNLPGIRTMVWAQGKQHRDLNQRGCLAAKFSSNELGCWGVQALTGKYSGGGYVTAAQGYEIQSCTAADGSVNCRLAEPHGLGDFFAFPITSLRGGEIEISAEGHGWTNGAAVLVEGNSTCNGIYTIERVSGPKSAKLARTGCSGSGGTIRRLYTGRFFDLKGQGAAALEGAQLVDFPAPDQVRAFALPASAAAIESGGFVYSNPKVAAFFRMSNVAGITWDRILFDISEPFRIFNVIAIGNRDKPDEPCDCALVDSYVNGMQFWQPITPGAGIVDAAQMFPPFSAVPVLVRAHVVKDLHMDGITLHDSAGFAFFADQFGAPGPQDVTFRHIAMNLPAKLVAGKASKGLAYNMRHVIELKAGARILMEGLQVQNWAAVGVSGASPIYFSYRTTDSQNLRMMQDLTLRNIFMRNVPVGIAIRTTGADGFAKQQPIRRVLIDNLLIDGIDYPNLQAAPHDQSLEVAGTFYNTPVGSGSALAIGGPAEDVRITRVTARRVRTKNVPNFLWLQDGRVNNFQVERSIIAYSPSGPEKDGVAAYAYSTGKLSPPVIGGGSKAFLEWTTRMGEPDPRSWFGTPDAPVGVIPCLSNSNTPAPAFERRNNANSMAESAFACSGKDCARWNVKLVGGDRQSCAEREAKVLNQDLQGIGPFEGLGADTKELARALGYFAAKVIEEPTGGKLLYAPLSAEVCTVDHSRDADFSIFIRGRDQGGEGTRSMQLGGYSPGEIAYYRVLCPKSIQIWGRFKTKAN